MIGKVPPKKSSSDPSLLNHDDRYYTETEINTWRNSVSQAEMAHVHGVGSDIQTQIDARCIPASPEFTGIPRAPDHGTPAVDMLVNVCYGTGAPPAAATTTIGALYFKHEAF